MTDIRTPLRHRWIRVIAAPVGVVALVGLAACGTSTDTTSAAAASSAVAAQPSAADDDTDGDDTDGDDDTDMADYRTCLEENGVTMPEPPAGGGGAPPQGGTPPSGAPAAGGSGGAARQAPPGVDGDTWAAAQEACADLAPTPPDGSAPTAGSGT